MESPIPELKIFLDSKVKSAYNVLMGKLNKKEWTKQENDLLLEYYYNLSSDALLAILPGRSSRDMAAQAAYLKRKAKVFNGS